MKVYPLPHMQVVKDLVPDMTNFYAQHRLIEPWLKTDTPAPPKEWRQSHADRAEARRALRVHPVRLLLDLVPELLVERGPLPRPGRAAAGLPLGQRLRATRRPASGSTRWRIPFRLYRCHTILNCTKACPKGLNPAKAIAELKKLMVERRV